MITGLALYFARWLSHRFAVVFRLTLPGQFDAVFCLITWISLLLYFARMIHPVCSQHE
jgi:hypothetical protein